MRISLNKILHVDSSSMLKWVRFNTSTVYNKTAAVFDLSQS